jgi:penicillin amidase
MPAGLWPTYSTNIARSSAAVVIRLLEREAATRQDVLLEAFREADSEGSKLLGTDITKWRWGNLHKAEFRHPLSSEFSLPAVSRGGDAFTVNATAPGPDFRQISGASYRQIFDVGQWDNSVAVNVPGQSGQPGSFHYADLLPLWSEGRYHPLPFSRKAVETYATQRLLLEPSRTAGKAKATVH